MKPVLIRKTNSNLECRHKLPTCQCLNSVLCLKGQHGELYYGIPKKRQHLRRASGGAQGIGEGLTETTQHLNWEPKPLLYFVVLNWIEAFGDPFSWIQLRGWSLQADGSDNLPNTSLSAQQHSKAQTHSQTHILTVLTSRTTPKLPNIPKPHGSHPNFHLCI